MVRLANYAAGGGAFFTLLALVLRFAVSAEAGYIAANLAICCMSLAVIGLAARWM